MLRSPSGGEATVGRRDFRMWLLFAYFELARICTILQATMSSMPSGYNMAREPEDEFGIAVSPSVYGLDGHNDIASSWLVMKQP
jgi:hypothetical protein